MISQSVSPTTRSLKTQKIKANTRTKAKFLENVHTKKHHMHSHQTQTHISAKKHNSADVTHSLQFHISSEIIVDVL